MITLIEARELLASYGCTVIPTSNHKRIDVWNAYGINERLLCTLEAITNYIEEI